MSDPARMQKCSQCGGALAPAKKEQVCIVEGTRFVGSVPAYACRECRSAFLPGRALEAFDLAVACELAERAEPSGERLRFLRRALGLRSLALAALLRVTPETLSRWEREQRKVDVMAWITVGSLVLEKAGRAPATAERLTRLSRRSTLPKTIQLKLGAKRGAIGITVTRARSTRSAPGRAATTRRAGVAQ